MSTSNKIDLTDEFVRQFKTLHYEKQSLEQEVETLKQQTIDGQVSEIEDLERKLKQSNGENEQLAGRLEALQKQFADSSNHLQSTNARLVEHQTEIDQLERQLRVAIAEKNEAIQKVDEQKQLLDQANSSPLNGSPMANGQARSGGSSSAESELRELREKHEKLQHKYDDLHRKHFA